MYPPKNVVFLAFSGDSMYDSFAEFMLCESFGCFTRDDYRRLKMADSKKVDLTNLEVQWVRKSVELQIASLKRSLTKEMPGSDIYILRQREIADLQTVLGKF